MTTTTTTYMTDGTGTGIGPIPLPALVAVDGTEDGGLAAALGEDASGDGGAEPFAWLHHLRSEDSSVEATTTTTTTTMMMTTADEKDCVVPAAGVPLDVGGYDDAALHQVPTETTTNDHKADGAGPSSTSTSAGNAELTVAARSVDDGGSDDNASAQYL
jgi:hypothetical protein